MVDTARDVRFSSGVEKRPLTRIGGTAPRPPISLRLLIALLALLQLAGPLAYALAEPAPVATSHQEHVGAQDDFGCRPLHDDAFCGSCRALSTEPLRSRTADRLAGLLVEPDAALRPLASDLPDDHCRAPLHARAPPRA